VTALSIIAELHDVRRFDHPRQLMSFLGLTPSEHSSGGVAKRGSITKAGNSRVRQLLIESSWHDRHRLAVGAKLAKRREGQPTSVIAIADRAAPAPSVLEAHGGLEEAGEQGGRRRGPRARGLRLGRSARARRGEGRVISSAHRTDHGASVLVTGHVASSPSSPGSGFALLGCTWR
jgi:hypothetical protein